MFWDADDWGVPVQKHSMAWVENALPFVGGARYWSGSTTPPTPEMPGTVNGGAQIQSAASGRCLDAPAAQTANGTYLQIWDCNGGVAQHWEYSGGQWKWVGGSSIANASGIYGTQGTAQANNAPGARWGASAWTDASGNFWLYGGSGVAGVVSNDLWVYSGGLWTWVSGSNMVNVSGIYGTQGAAAISSVPGARLLASVWTDPSGNFWLFSGYGYDSSATQGYLNDGWRYAP